MDFELYKEVHTSIVRDTRTPLFLTIPALKHGLNAQRDALLETHSRSTTYGCVKIRDNEEE